MWQRRFVAGVLRHRWAVVSVVTILSVVALGFVSNLRFATNLEAWFLENDPTLVSYRQFKERFGADRIGVVALTAEDVFTPHVLETIDRLTRKLEDAPHVNRVRSLTTVRIAELIDDGLEINALVDGLPKTRAEARRLREAALDHPLLAGSLISPDGATTVLVVELTPEGNTPEGQSRFVEAARRSVNEEQATGVQIRPAGSPFLAETVIAMSQRDFAVFSPVGALLVIVIGFVVFRRISAALIPLPVVLIAALWTFGVMGALGMNVTVISPMLLMLIMAVGVADTVHVLSDYYRHLVEEETSTAAVEHSVSHLLLPCFFTSVTTAGGLLSLRASDLQPLAEFGTLAAMGVVFAFVLSVTLVPIILGAAHPPDPAFVERQRHGPLSRLLERLGRRARSGSRRTVVVAAILAVVSVLLALRVDVVVNPLNFFRDSNPLKRDTIAIDEAIGGTTSIEFLVETREGGLQDPAILQRLDDFQQWLESRPGTSKTLSVVDLLRDMDRILRGENEGRVPDSRALAAQYFLLLEGEEDFDQLVQSNYSVGRITARVNLSDADELIGEMPRVEEEIARRFDDGELQVEPTGFIRLVAKMDVYLVQSQMRSFLLAIGVITLMMSVFLRSVRLGLFSMIPNLLPVVFGIAFMTLTGIRLDQGTAMIPSIALGLVVDDSVHFLYRYRFLVTSGVEAGEALHRTMIETGRPISVTSVILAVAFGALALGSFNPAIFFGVITAVVVLAALVATLVLLPAALVVFRPRL